LHIPAPELPEKVESGEKQLHPEKGGSGRDGRGLGSVRRGSKGGEYKIKKAAITLSINGGLGGRQIFIICVGQLVEGWSDCRDGSNVWRQFRKNPLSKKSRAIRPSPGHVGVNHPRSFIRCQAANHKDSIQKAAKDRNSKGGKMGHRRRGTHGYGIKSISTFGGLVG